MRWVSERRASVRRARRGASDRLTLARHPRSTQSRSPRAQWQCRFANDVRPFHALQVAMWCCTSHRSRQGGRPQNVRTCSAARLPPTRPVALRHRLPTALPFRRCPSCFTSAELPGKLTTSTAGEEPQTHPTTRVFRTEADQPPASREASATHRHDGNHHECDNRHECRPRHVAVPMS